MDFIKERDVKEIQGAIEQNLRVFQRRDAIYYQASINFYNKHKLWVNTVLKTVYSSCHRTVRGRLPSTARILSGFTHICATGAPSGF